MEVSFHVYVRAKQKEDACKEIGKIVQRVVKDADYQQDKITDWVNKICDMSLNALKKLSGNFKYMVNCIIAEKSEIDIQSSCFYSPFDANCLITWENQNLTVVVNLFAVAL